MSPDDDLIPLAGGGPAIRIRPAAEPPGGGAPWHAAIDEDASEADLVARLAAGASGVLLRLSGGPAGVARMDARIAVAEAVAGRPDGSTPIAVALTTAAAVASLPVFGRPSARLAAIGLETADLVADLALPAPADGSAPVVLARGLVVLAARAAGVPAFERIRPGPDLARRLSASAADGFALAIVRSRLV